MKLKKVLAGIMATVTAVATSVCGMCVIAVAVEDKITYQGYAYDFDSVPRIFIYNNLDKIYGKGQVPDILCSSDGIDHSKPILIDESKSDQMIVENIQPTDKITLSSLSGGKKAPLYVTFYTVNYKSPLLKSYSSPYRNYGVFKTGMTLQEMIDQYNEDLNSLRYLDEFKNVKELTYENIGGLWVWNDNFGFSSLTWELTIEPGNESSNNSVSSDISVLTISKIPSQSYTGKAIKPSITVKDGSNKLVEGTDYTVSYKNNTKIGTATVTVTGKGDYTGTKTLTFKIVPKKVKLTGKSSGADETLSWKKSAGAAGYEVYSSVSGGKFTKLTTTKNLKYSAKLTSGKNYKFKVRPYAVVNGKKVYGSWSNVVTVKN